MNDRSQVAIDAISVYLPKTRLSAVELAERANVRQDFIEDFLGIHYVYLPSEDDHAGAMAVKASRQALVEAKLSAQQIDLILYIGSSYTEYPNWVAALKLQKDLGAINAVAFDINQSCNGLFAGLSVASAMMQSDPHINSVLLAGGQRTTDHIDYSNPLTHFLLNTSAGGGAVVLRRGKGGIARLLDTCLLSDGSACEAIVVPVGGSKAPIANPEDGQHATMTVQSTSSLNDSVAKKLIENTVHCVHQCIMKSGRQVSDLAFITFHHARIDHQLALLDSLGLSENQSISLEDYGHMGSLDSINSLQIANRSKLLNPNDLIVCAGAGMGYTWGATAIEWSGIPPS